MNLVSELGNTVSLLLHHSHVQNFLLSSSPFSYLSSMSHSFRHCSRCYLCSTHIPSTHPDFTCREYPRDLLSLCGRLSLALCVCFILRWAAPGVLVSALLGQSLTNGVWEWEIAQPPCPTGTDAEEMFFTVPSRNRFFTTEQHDL